MFASGSSFSMAIIARLEGSDLFTKLMCGDVSPHRNSHLLSSITRHLLTFLRYSNQLKSLIYNTKNNKKLNTLEVQNSVAYSRITRFRGVCILEICEACPNYLLVCQRSIHNNL